MLQPRARQSAAVFKACPRAPRRQFQPATPLTAGQRCCVAQAQATAAAPRIDIQGKHLKVTDSIQDYVRKKVGHAVEPFAPVLRTIDVRLSARGGEQTKGGKEQRIEVTIRTRRHGVVRAEDTQFDLYAAIDVAADKVTRSLRKLKEKAVARGNWPGRGSSKGLETISEAQYGDDGAANGADGGVAAGNDGSISEEEALRDEARAWGGVPTDDEVEDAKAQLQFPESVKRTKVFYLEPMTLREAIANLEAVDHDFYIYLDADSQHVQVVYKRNEGGQGVLITIPDNADLM